MESFTGTFEGIHAHFGTSSDLATRHIYFFNATYVTPRRDGCGRLEPINPPTLASIDWPLPDSSTVVAFKRRIEMGVWASMKCTYGSHKATVGFFLPLHVFVFIFHSA